MHRAARCLLVAWVVWSGLHLVMCFAEQAHSSQANDAREIYSAFLAQWMGKSEAATNVADKAALPTQADIQEFNECTSAGGDGIFHWPSHTTDEDLKGALASLRRVHLVDSRHWHPADPGRLIAKGQSVEAAVDAGLAHGLMTLSTISFTEAHDIAMFKYSFVCGALCGHGGTVMFKKTPNGWVQSTRRCSSWMS